MLKKRIARYVPDGVLSKVKPSDNIPGETRTYKQEDEEITVFIPWHVDSDIARIIGEAKSLPTGCAVIPCPLVPVRDVAFIARAAGVSVFTDDDNLYFVR